MQPLTSDYAEGFDLSHWQGPMAASDAQAVIDAGKRFAIVRHSTEQEWMRALTIQQAATFKAAGLPVLGYAWCYWDANPLTAAGEYLQLAAQTGVKVLALNFEDDPTGKPDPVHWLQTASDALQAGGVIPMLCTFTDWPHRYGIDLSLLGSRPWWVE